MAKSKPKSKLAPRIYGQWAGNPNGVPEDPTHCIHAVRNDFQPGGYQCTRKRGHGPAGLYCKQHAWRYVNTK
jgi:hypothetical protein